MDELKVGDRAPEFTLEASGDRAVSLHDLRGHDVILYFYPKDDTPGCTKEACSFRDSHQTFDSSGTVVLGISPDTVASHNAFATKYGLPFTLLADPDHRVAEAYGVWKEKTNYGRTYMGIERSTFHIDPEGRIAHIWRRVKPDVHVEQVLKTLQPI